MKKKREFQKNQGQILIEAIISLGIIAFGLVAVLALLYRSLGLNKTVSDQFIGTYLAAEGIEITKNIVDANVKNGRSFNNGLGADNYEADYASPKLNQAPVPRFLMFDSASGLYGYSQGDPTPFKRTISISYPNNNSGNEVQVNSRVSWSDRGGSFDINLEDHFFNWQRPQP